MSETDDTDNDCAVLAAQGDVGAFRQLVEIYQSRAISIAFRLSNDFHSAEDLAQEAFIKAYQNLKNFDPKKGSFSTWLFTIVRNTSLNHRRKHRTIPTSCEIHLESLSPSPAEESARREQWRLLDRTVDQLEEPFRTAFILAEIEELPLAEIAAIEGAAVGTIKSRVSRARSRLREALKKSNSQLP